MTKKLYSRENQQIAKKLRMARLETGLNQQDVAEKLSKTQSYVSKVEQGQLLISALDLKNMCALYGVKVEWILSNE